MSTTATIAHERIGALIAEPRIGPRLLRRFHESIAYVRTKRDDWCSVHWVDSSGEFKLRLFAGGLIVFTLEPSGAWLATSPNGETDLDSLSSWSWDHKDYPEYVRVPSRNGHYHLSQDPGHEWSIIQERHFAFLKAALSPGIAPGPRTREMHDQSIIDALDDLFESTPAVARESDPDPSNRETIPDVDGVAIEGAPKLVHHIRRERNRRLVDEKLRRARQACDPVACEACGFVPGTTYPLHDSSNILEVHHLRPLGDAASDGQHTRLEDLAILCPNCHRAIHRTNPMMSVETLRTFIRRRAKDDSGNERAQEPAGDATSDEQRPTAKRRAPTTAE